MKTKFFFAVMAAVAIVGCNKEPQGVNPVEDGQRSMIQVDIKAAGTLTRAEDPTYENGSADENAVNSIDFYFFTAEGQPYSVVNTGANVISWTNGNEGENVEKVSDVILVIKNSEVAPPAKVVAILNSGATYGNVALDKLGEQVVSTLHTNNTNFVMSSSVYRNASFEEVMVATDIDVDNIFTIAEGYEDLLPGMAITADKYPTLQVNPIDIYVERVAAKVQVKAANGVDFNLIPVYDEDGKTQMLASDKTPVYAKILGWEVTNATDEASLVKNIDPSWTDTELGFIWNNPAHYRSYWAATTAEPAHTHTFASIAEKATVAGADYYFENTHPQEHSQLLVAAQLVDAEGDEISLARWYNVLYTVEDLQEVMVNYVFRKLYVEAENSTDENKIYRSINVDDVVFQQRPHTAAERRYEVTVEPKENVTYYSVEGTTATELKIDEVEEILSAIEPAQMWNEGHSYYFTNIKHLGDAETVGEFGIVRNHVYDIEITGLKGFGTPVWEEDEIIIPEIPADQPALNLAAQINILSWRLVSQDVELGF